MDIEKKTGREFTTLYLLINFFSGVIRIGAVNCQDEYWICQRQGITGIFYSSQKQFPDASAILVSQSDASAILVSQSDTSVILVTQSGKTV